MIQLTAMASGDQARPARCGNEMPRGCILLDVRRGEVSDLQHDGEDDPSEDDGEPEVAGDGIDQRSDLQEDPVVEDVDVDGLVSLQNTMMALMTRKPTTVATMIGVPQPTVEAVGQPRQP